jgi:Domain of unknown function (DUF5664)
MEGTKHDNGKLPIHLLPAEALFAAATILDFGAKKYTKEFDNEWERFFSVPCVQKLVLSTAKGYVEVAMKSTSEKPTWILSVGKKKTTEYGESVTQTEIESIKNVDSLIQFLEIGTERQKEKTIWLNLESLKKFTMPNVLKVVKSAAQETTYTLTTVIKQENSEVSDSLEMMWKVFQEHLNISKPLKKNEGTRNWEKGMKWSRVFSASMRHLWCWWAGKQPTSTNFVFGDLDDETGFSHLWHALCCVIFLVTYEERKVGEDDRPV